MLFCIVPYKRHAALYNVTYVNIHGQSYSHTFSWMVKQISKKTTPIQNIFYVVMSFWKITSHVPSPVGQSGKQST
jgi:hypothetical protein